MLFNVQLILKRRLIQENIKEFNVENGTFVYMDQVFINSCRLFFLIKSNVKSLSNFLQCEKLFNCGNKQVVNFTNFFLRIH